MLEALGSGRYFSTLDAAAGYWQIPLRDEDKGKSAFICSEGLYEFNVMPFGLCNAPATYQRLMNLLLAGLTWRSCLVYLDDILIFSPTFERHLADMREVFHRIRASGMLLKPSKCFFGLSTVQYLGHVVTPEGIRPDPAKVIRIRNFPTPRNVSEVRTFLGMAGYYRKFVRNFSIVAAPISNLTAKDQPFSWTEECAQAFEVLRNAIAEDAVLNHPEFDRPFIIDSDASGVGLGAVLSQVVDGVERPVCFASRALQPAERIWHTQEKEALGILWALQQFRHFVLGADFTVRTDHRSLELLKKAKSGRLARWAMQLAEFGNLKIVHRDGTKHANADTMSRLPLCDSEAIPDEAVVAVIAPDIRKLPTITELQDAQAKDTGIRKLVERSTRTESRAGVHGMVDATSQLFKPLLPDALVERVVKCMHEPPHYGHLGARKTTSRLLMHFTLPGAAWKVREVVDRCLACKQRKRPLPRHGKMASTPASEPGETVAMDFAGPYCTTKAGNRFVLVFVDWFTKWVEAVALPDQRAETVVKCFYDRIICRHGCPRRLLSDRGPQFKATITEAVCEAFSVRKIFSSAYYPQGDGQAERFMRTMNDSLAIVSSRFYESWDEYLPAVIYAYNTSVNASTGFTPFELVFGRKPTFPETTAFAEALGAVSAKDASSLSTLQYFRNVADNLAEVREAAHANLERAWAEAKRRYDGSRKSVQLHTGDAVLIRLSDYERGMFPTLKLAPRWSDPAEVLEVLSNGKTYRVRRSDGTIETVNVARLLPVTGHAWERG